MALPQPKITFRKSNQTDFAQAANQPYFDKRVNNINSKLSSAQLNQNQPANTFNKINSFRTSKASNDNSGSEYKTLSFSKDSGLGSKLSVGSLVGNNPALVLAKKIKVTARVTAVSSGILSWSLPLWLFVQLPFAIIGLLMFGLMGAVDALASLFASENEVTGNVGSWFMAQTASIATWIAGKAAAGINLLTGIDLNIASMAEGLFFILYFIIFLIGFFTIITASFVYTIGNLRPLSGQGAGMKIGLFIMALVGYMIPILNLFPWHLPWMAAVWKYPK